MDRPSWTWCPWTSCFYRTSRFRLGRAFLLYGSFFTSSFYFIIFGDKPILEVVQIKKQLVQVGLYFLTGTRTLYQTCPGSTARSLSTLTLKKKKLMLLLKCVLEEPPYGEAFRLGLSGTSSESFVRVSHSPSHLLLVFSTSCVVVRAVVPSSYVDVILLPLQICGLAVVVVYEFLEEAFRLDLLWLDEQSCSQYQRYELFNFHGTRSFL